MSFEQSLSPSGRKLLGIGAAVVLGGAVTGFFAGTRAAPPLQPESNGAPSTAASSEALPGQTYLELRQRRYGSRSAVRSPLPGLREGMPKYGDPVTLSAAAHEEAVAARTNLRAFDGAPPFVPHPIDEQSSHSCIACHEHGLRVEGRRAPVMSHRFLDNCTSCHATVADRPFGEARVVENDFDPLASPGPGERASEAAPPTIPHGVHMRETCAACHGLGGPEGLRTTHPELQSCTQCHAATSTDLPWRP
ncbi:MAG: hypothetical protein JRI23_31025 [Deltaproteobacteria bacterium]|jgi:cytochrome c-type protein NapB|nr:hypothetical protein [Deltaproteobacteria bacterium]MBW2536635.1 hypothetical protein [Deltaproteobacteria bacterium]